MKRREFLQMTSAAGLSMLVPGVNAFAQMTNSANSKVRLAMIGTNSRGAQLASLFSKITTAEIIYVCDPDDNAAQNGIKALPGDYPVKPKVVRDFRQALDDKNVDGVVIATPDHWHAPATLMAMQAGKSVYVEKPCGHNCAEGEMLIASQKKYPKQTIQMGNQRRSAPVVKEAIQAIHEGVIGRAFHAKTWYARKRDSIGYGKVVPVPAHLDYELWQGPAPRRPYKDNLIHYNWHWFWNWGTGETCNNGTHEFDVARWALGVDFPERVVSTGGRYRYEDDWEFWDIQQVGLEYPGRKMISWEGHSVDQLEQYGLSRGTMIFGENGQMLIDPGFYRIYDHDRKVVKEVRGGDVKNKASATDTKAPTSDITILHCQNFIDCIRGDAKPNSPIHEGHKSIVMCHLGNVALKTQSSLKLNPENGHILDNPAAEKMWGREYEKGWEPTI